MQIEVRKNELYILPSFFTNFYSINISKDNYEAAESAVSAHLENFSINVVDDSTVFDSYAEIKMKTNNSLLDHFEKIRYIPLSKSIIDYENNTWDFSPYIVTSDKHRKLQFGPCAEPFRNLLKNYILFLLLQGNIKYSSLQNKFMILRKFFNYLDSINVTDTKNIDEAYVESYLKRCQLELSPITFLKVQTSIKEILKLYDVEYKTNLYTEGIAKLCTRMEHNKIKAIQKSQRRKAIPEDYFDHLVSILLRTMENETLNDMNRAAAAMLLIDSQTGLRASELSLLEANSVEVVEINGKEYRMIHYKVIKTAKGNSGVKDEITYINDISYKAYNIVMKLHADNRKKYETNCLFCPNNGEVPTSNETFVKYLKRFCILNYKELDAQNSIYKDTLESEISVQQYLKNYHGSKTIDRTYLANVEGLTEETVLYMPIVHQFRNTVVNRLIKKGVQLEFIRRYMGHLSQEMTAAYASYSDNDIQESMAFSEEILKTYLTGDAKILGNSGEKLMTRIDEWIKENNLNVADDLNEIVDRLLKVVPIRSKHGGMCIKGSKLTDACSVDAKTDEFYCAYGICPNVCHFYFMADISYSDFKAAKEILEYNQRNGFKRQAEKEQSKLRFIVLNRLTPELQELEKEIINRGKDEIIKHHPNMGNMIINLSKIKEEIEKWNYQNN